MTIGPSRNDGEHRRKPVPQSFTFTSHGTACDAWHFPAADDRLATEAGRPAVVMAHGFAGTKDCGLHSFAEQLSGIGCDVVAFDYRGFGASAGQPRGIISPAGQIDDYRAALTATGRLSDVDAGRLVLWGVSMSGGTVLAVAAGRTDIAAVIALTPLVSALSRDNPEPLPARTVTTSGKRSAAHTALLLTAAARDKYAAARHRSRIMLPAVGRLHELALLNLAGTYDDYLAIAGPTWRNEVGAAIALDALTHRPDRFAAQLRCQALFQIADFDRCVPVRAATRAAVRARARIRHYPCDHFDVYPGRRWHECVRDHQAQFLSDVLSVSTRSVNA